MADQKITALTADASPSSDDLFITVNDPGGTPANRKVTFASMEAALAIASMSDASDFATVATLASTSNGDGASLIGVEDSGGLITATTVEGALAENRAAIDALEAAGYITATLTDEEVQDIVGAMFSGNTETLVTVTYQDADGTVDVVVDNDLANYSNSNSGFSVASDLASTSNGNGASLIGIEDAGTLITATTVEGALAENRAAIDALEAANYITDVTGDNLSALADVTISAIDSGELLKWGGSGWVNNTLAEAGIAAASHNHSASEITSGTLAHERGGLEADVSAYDGLVKISGGATSAVTDNSSNWDTAYGWGDHSTAGYVPDTRQVIAGDGLSDGGALSGNVTLNLDIFGQTENASPASGDFVIVENSAGGTVRKVQLGNLPGSGANLSGLGDVTITGPSSGDLLKYNGSAWVDQSLSELDLPTLTNLASTSNGVGASLIGIEDSGTLITATTVEGALAENRAAIDAIEADYLTSSGIGSTIQGFDAGLAYLDGLDFTDEATFKAGVNLEAGTDFYSVSGADAAFQALDADLTAIAGLSSADGNFIVGSATGWVAESGDTALASLGLTANGTSLVKAANYAAMRTLLDLEAGTDFYSISGADAAFQPLDSDLTAVAALTTTAAGLTVLEFADPGADRILAWDDTAGAAGPIALADLTDEASPATGDYLLIYGAEGDLRKADWSTLPSAGGGLTDIVDDTSPQLGGDLDTNGSDIVAGNGDGLLTGTTAGNTLLLGAYDVDGTSYKTFATLTANNTPTMNLDTAVTIDGKTVLRDSTPLNNAVPVQSGSDGSILSSTQLSFTTSGGLFSRAQTTETTTVQPGATIAHDTSGTAAAGFGVSLIAQAENAGGSVHEIGTLEWEWTTPTASSEVSDLVGYIYEGGAKTEAFRVDTSANQFDLPSGWAFAVNGTPIGGGGLSNIVEDTTPQLGGDLDLNGNVITGLEIGTDVQAYDADLDTWATLTPSANAQSLVTAADYAAMRALLDLEAGTDFYSISAADAAFQPLDSDLTSWAGVTRAAGFDTFAATPSSANLASLVTGETGSGALVFGTSPALTTPDLGTPSALTLTNATGLPVSTGVSGLGTGVATLLGTPTEANFQAALSDGVFRTAGTETIWMPASAMTARTTSGAATGSAETTTNKVMVETLDFDTAADEFAQFSVAFPKSWNGGTVTAQFFWSNASGTGTVAWAIQGMALADSDVLDTAFGTAVVTTDTVTTAGDLMVSAASTAVTIAGTPGDDELVYFQVYRDVSADTLGVDARLHGVKLFYTTDAANDD